MLEIFRELRGLLRVSHVHIDSWVFRLHYSVTTTCMFAFSLIVSAKTVRWQSHRLHSFERHPWRCLEHLLLDPLDVHDSKCLLEAYRLRRSTSWSRQDTGPWRKTIPQVLPVGVLLSIPTGECCLFFSTQFNFFLIVFDLRIWLLPVFIQLCTNGLIYVKFALYY